MGALIFVAVMLVLLWILLIAPQRRRQQQQRRMVEELRPGVDVLTAGGVYATVLEVREDDLTVEIAPGTNVRLDKRAVASVLPEDEVADEGEVLEEGEASAELEETHEEPSRASRT